MHAWRSAGEARARLADTIEIAARGADNAVRFGDEYGVPIAVIRKLLSGADEDFTDLCWFADDQRPDARTAARAILFAIRSAASAVGDTKREVELARPGLATIERVSTVRLLRHPITWLAAENQEPIRTRDLAVLWWRTGQARAITWTGRGVADGIRDRHWPDDTTRGTC